MNHVMELQPLVHVDGRPDWPVTHQRPMAPIMGEPTRQQKQSSATRAPDDPASMVIDF